MSVQWVATLQGVLGRVFTFGRAAVTRRVLERAAAVCEERGAEHRRQISGGDPGGATMRQIAAAEAEDCAHAIRALANAPADTVPGVGVSVRNVGGAGP